MLKNIDHNIKRGLSLVMAAAMICPNMLAVSALQRSQQPAAPSNAAVVLTTAADSGSLVNKLRSVSSDDYTPVNVAILMDASGSMFSSDTGISSGNSVSREAGAQLIKMINTDQNQVAIFKYSTKCEKLTDLSNVSDFDKKLDTMDTMREDTLPDDPNANTHMLEAVEEAAKYLRDNSREGVKNVIVVFTDGSENGRLDEDDPAKCTDEAIEKEVSKALGGKKVDDLIVYSVAYDYEDTDKNGNKRHSVTGPNGEKNGFGAKILEKMAEATNGEVLYTEGNISDLYNQFEQILGKLMVTDIKQIDEFAGDGKKHSTSFYIGPSALSATIYIKCADPSELAKGTITLNYDDQGQDAFKNLVLKDRETDSTGTVGFITDTITMNNPPSGNWTLTIDGVKSDSTIKVDLVNGYETSSSTEIELLHGGKTAPIENAQKGDTLKLKTKLFARGEEITDKALYTDESMKTRVYISDQPLLPENYVRNHTAEQVESELQSSGLSYLPMAASEEGFTLNDVTIDWDNTKYINIYTYSTEQGIKCFDCIPVSVGEPQVEIVSPIDDIMLSTASDPFTVGELSRRSISSDVTVWLESGYDSSICAVELVEDSIKITPLAIGQTTVGLKYTSKSNSDNSAVMNFNVIVENTRPDFKLPAEVKTQNIKKGEEITVTGLKGYASDPDGDVMKISASTEDTANIEINYDDTSDTLTIKGIAQTDTPAKIEISASDGTDDTKDIISVNVAEMDEADKFKIIIPEKFASLTLVEGKEITIPQVNGFVEGIHSDAMVMSVQTDDTANVEVNFDESTNSLNIKALKKTDEPAKVYIVATDGENQVSSPILVTVKKPTNWSLIIGLIGGGLALIGVGICVAALIAKARKRVALNSVSANVVYRGNNITMFVAQNLMDYFPGSTSITLYDIMTQVETLSPASRSAFDSALMDGSVQEALCSVKFLGGKPNNSCRVSVKGRHPSLSDELGMPGDAIVETLFNGAEQTMVFKVYDENQMEIMRISLKVD